MRPDNCELVPINTQQGKIKETQKKAQQFLLLLLIRNRTWRRWSWSRWTHSFMTDRQVKSVPDGEVGQAHQVDTDIPQGSPAALILFVTYLLGIFDEMESAVPGIKGPSFADDIAWWAEGGGEQEVADRLAEAAEAAIGSRTNGITFDQG
jgi:hypothetical protein